MLHDFAFVAGLGSLLGLAIVFISRWLASF